jgi:hypothetical protein
MPKQKDFTYKGKKKDENVQFSVKLSMTPFEQNELKKYLQATEGNASEFVSFAVNRVIKFDKYYKSVKDKITLKPEYSKLFPVKGKK